MKNSILLAAFIFCFPSLGLQAAFNSKYETKELKSPETDSKSVSPAQAAEEAGRLFCGIAGKNCQTKNLTSKCEAVEDKKKQLAAFKCEINWQNDDANQPLTALNINLDKNLVFHSSNRIQFTSNINPEKESKEPTKSKKASSR